MSDRMLARRVCISVEAATNHLPQFFVGPSVGAVKVVTWCISINRLLPLASLQSAFLNLSLLEHKSTCTAASILQSTPVSFLWEFRCSPVNSNTMGIPERPSFDLSCR